MFVVPYVNVKSRSFTKRAYARGEMSEFASKLSDNFKKVYVADEDGITRNKPQLDVVREISEEIPTLYEGNQPDFRKAGLSGGQAFDGQA